VEVAIISPRSMVREFSTRSKWQLALAQHVLADKEYARFFWERSEAGDYVICDNGTAEGERVTNEQLLEAAQIIAADEVILPDVWRDARATIKAVEEALLTSLRQFNVMAVPQGMSAFEWLYCLFELLNIPEIDVIGLPKNLDKVFPDLLGSDESETVSWFGRAGVTNWVCEMLEALPGPEVQLHLLGIWSDYRELLLYSDTAKKYVRSIDTSSPVHCGLLGLGYPCATAGPWGSPPEPGLRRYVEPEKSMDFDAAPLIADREIVAQIHRNISWLLVAAGAKEVPEWKEAKSWPP
jgi:hypothetical protein